MAAVLDSRTGAKSNPMESNTQALEKSIGEEEEEQRILQFLDSIDSYLSLFDSLSSSLRQVIFVFLFLHWFFVFFIDYKVDSIMGFVYFVAGYWNLYGLCVLMHPKSQSSFIFVVFVLSYSNLL